ncbi:MAG: extracellular solute-binding protein [Desulforhopalus sp.]
MKKALSSVGLILVFFALALLFTSPQIEEKLPPDTSPSALLKQKISLYHYFSGSLGGGLGEMLYAVNNKDPDYQVIAQALDHEAFKSTIHAILAKGNPPELFTYWAGAKTQTLVDQDKLEPIDDIWRAAPLTDRFTTPVAEAASTYNNKKYLLPITEHFVVFFYNKQLFEREDISAPRSWPQLVELAENLKSRGIIPFALGAKERWPAQFWFDYLLLRTAGPAYRQDLMANRAAYTDQEVRKVYSMWGALLQKEYFNQNANNLDWAEAAHLVCSGKAAMTLLGTWAFQLFAEEQCGLAEESGFDFFIFPIINRDVPKVILGSVDGLVLPKGSKGQQFAKAILNYFSEVEPQQRLSQGSGAFAPNSLVPKQFYSPLRQRIIRAKEASPFWAFNYDLATSSAIADKGLDSFNEIIAFPDQGSEILENLQAEVEKKRNSP